MDSHEVVIQSSALSVLGTGYGNSVQQSNQLQGLQDDITTHKGQLEALVAVGRALQDVTSPKDAVATVNS
ncbi:hypothetical protein EMCRGX_G006867 [Ephydatia muelleri]|eukprot:Em0002g1592a